MIILLKAIIHALRRELITQNKTCLGDWNTKVGNKAEPNVGNFCLEDDAGEQIIEFYEANYLWQIHASNNQIDDCTHHQMVNIEIKYTV